MAKEEKPGGVNPWEAARTRQGDGRKQIFSADLTVDRLKLSGNLKIDLGRLIEASTAFGQLTFEGSEHEVNDAITRLQAVHDKRRDPREFQVKKKTVGGKPTIEISSKQVFVMKAGGDNAELGIAGASYFAARFALTFPGIELAPSTTAA